MDFEPKRNVSVSENKEIAADAEDCVRFRAILIGLLLLPPLGFWIFQSELVRYTFGTWAAPFYTAVFILFVLTVANSLLSRFFPRFSLNKIELFAIYAIVSVASGLMATDMMGILIPLMGHSTWFATPENNWAKLFEEALPKWLLVTDRHALIGYYNGSSSFYRWEHFRAWLTPSIYWILFTWALVLSLFSLSSILRKQWQDRERFTFPIVQLPLAMASEPSTFFRNGWMWVGFAIAGGATLINGLAYLFPSVPMLAIKRHGFVPFVTFPWNSVGKVNIAFYFFAIALGFIMPLDVSVSLWVFYILFLMEKVGAAAIGQAAGGVGAAEFPYYTDQAFGAYMAVFVASIWGLRKHLKAVFLSAIKHNPEDDTGEPLSYRTASRMFVISSLWMIAFAVIAGMSPIVAVGFFLVYLSIAVMICRVRCELGFPVHDMHDMGPNSGFTRIFGAASFSPRNLGMFTMFFWFNRVYRSHPMPHMMESMRLAGGSGKLQKGMARALLIGALATVPICFWVYLHNFYQFGASSAKMNVWALGYAEDGLARLHNWLTAPNAPTAGGRIAMGVGFCIAMALAILRRKVVGFPFHPLAYAAANSWGMHNLWLPIMIGSIVKAVTLKGFGLRGFRKAIYFFYGLMLGEFVIGCGWTLFGLIFGIQTYDFWP